MAKLNVLLTLGVLAITYEFIYISVSRTFINNDPECALAADCPPWKIKNLPNVYIGSNSAQLPLVVAFFGLIYHDLPTNFRDNSPAPRPFLYCFFKIIDTRVALVFLAMFACDVTSAIYNEKDGAGNEEYIKYLVGVVFSGIAELIFFLACGLLNFISIPRPPLKIRIGFLLLSIRYLIGSSDQFLRLRGNFQNTGTIDAPFIIILLQICVAFYFKAIMAQKMLSKTAMPDNNYMTKRYKLLDAGHGWLNAL